MRDMFLIDLKANWKNPEITIYKSEMILDDMKYCKVKKASDLDDYDWKVFETESQAEAWLKRYVSVLKNLDNSKIRKISGGGLPYKRRYIVQTLMGEKFQTYRDYSKNWTKGKLFNLNDQTFFLTVRLISIEKIGAKFKFSFELP